MATGADPSTDRHVPSVGRVEVDPPQPVVGSLYAPVCVGQNPKLVTDLFVRSPIVWVIEGAPRSILGQGGLAARPVFCASGGRRGSSTETASGGLEPLNGLALTRRSPWWRTRGRNSFDSGRIASGWNSMSARVCPKTHGAGDTSRTYWGTEFGSGRHHSEPGCSIE